MSCTVAVALGPAARFRPSDDAICELGTASLAVICGPGMLWNAMLAFMAQGSGYEATSFTCGCIGGASLQPNVLGDETPVMIDTRGGGMPARAISGGVVVLALSAGAYT